MGWVTLYITGNSGFNSEVWRQLEQSDISFMPGTVEEDRNLSLYWVPENLPLREVKKAIGSKIIFKYRLRFYGSLEQFEQEQVMPRKDRFTAREEAMIREMKDWQARKIRQSA